MKNNIIIIFSILIVSVIGVGSMTFQSVYASAPNFQDLLTKLDADLDHMINMCSKDIHYTVKERCINTIEESWWIECREHYDKLDTCKNGKVENFLKSNGRPT